jgi:hypothetical protein
VAGAMVDFVRDLWPYHPQLHAGSGAARPRCILEATEWRKIRTCAGVLRDF